MLIEIRFQENAVRYQTDSPPDFCAIAECLAYLRNYRWIGTRQPKEEVFYRKAVCCAHAAHSYVQGSERSRATAMQAAKEGIQDACKLLQEQDFFAALDACGGQQALTSAIAHEIFPN